MKIKDLIREEIDIDVVDAYDERCFIAFVGPLKLTKNGKTRFSDVLDIPIQHHGGIISLLAKSAREAEECKKFFYSAAGFCSTAEWDKWFKEA